MDVQAWSPNIATVQLIPGKVAPVQGGHLDKPGGGLWTSTWDESYGGGWLDWCVGQQFGLPPYSVWLLTPDPAARVYTIDSAAALRALADRYPADNYLGLGRRAVDWPAVGADWDAVRLTEEAHWATRMALDLGTYSWDCESTCWYRWCFTAVEHYGLWQPPSAPCTDHDGDSCWRCSGTGTRWLSRYDRADA